MSFSDNSDAIELLTQSNSDVTELLNQMLKTTYHLKKSNHVKHAKFVESLRGLASDYFLKYCL